MIKHLKIYNMLYQRYNSFFKNINILCDSIINCIIFKINNFKILKHKLDI